MEISSTQEMSCNKGCFARRAIMLGTIALMFFLVSARLASDLSGGLKFLAILFSIFFSLVTLIYMSEGWALYTSGNFQKTLHWIRSSSTESLAVALLVVFFPVSFFKISWKKHKKRPILLVHGYINHSAVWLYHGRRLKKAGFGPIYAINLGYPFLSILDYVKKVDKTVKRIAKKTGQDPVLIGHSMGGLISSYYAVKVAKPGQISDVITIATPHLGTEVARAGFGKCAKEMRKNSSFVKDLSDAIKKNKTTRFYFMATEVDQLVVPYSSSLLDKEPKRQYVLKDVGHAALLYSRRVSDKLCEWLSEMA